MDLGRVGIWALPFRTADANEAADAARELEALGYGALWVPESGARTILDVLERLVEATERLVVASGICNIWMHEPDEVADRLAALDAAHRDRVLLGLGASHAPLV